jgi:hypothetical protein
MVDVLGCLAALLREPNAPPEQFVNAIIELSFPQEAVEQAIALQILDESIIIERSPPIAETLMSLVHGATSTSLGILVGVNLAPDPYLMVVTVPAGIILMGTALGISKGLERGLAKRVERVINPAARRKKDK